MNPPHTPRSNCWHIIALTSCLLTIACSKPPAGMSASLTCEVPADVDADALGDLDWHMITSNNLGAAEVIAFDQRAGADSVRNVNAVITGGKMLVHAGVTQYHWANGETNHEISEISPGLQIQGRDEDSSGMFAIEVVLPKNARRIVIHGGSSKGTPSISAQIDGQEERTIVDCDPENDVTWAYNLSVTNGGGKTVRITVSSSTDPQFSSAVTVSGVFVSSK